MNFLLATKMERMDAAFDVARIARYTLDITIASGSYSILAWWAEEANDNSPGMAFAFAVRWYPTRPADGVGFFYPGSGACPREIGRMASLQGQSDAWRHTQEMRPCVRGLWKGNHERGGEILILPISITVSRPLQKPAPTRGAARMPATQDYAVREGCDIMPRTLSRGRNETAVSRLNEATAALPGVRRPILAMAPHIAVYDKKDNGMIPVGVTKRPICPSRQRHLPELFVNRVIPTFS